MIQYYNRLTKKIETELVYGGELMSWAYQNPVGFFLTEHVLSKRWLSLLMGAYESSSLSTNKIEKFVARYKIPMGDFEVAKYASFNDFFIRKFKPGKRNFDQSSKVFCAGAEARYLAFENIKIQNQRFLVKGFEIDLNELLKNEELAAEFEGGTFIIARLCPVDYHRFHFPISGSITKHYRVPGYLHSVNPLAFENAPKVFLNNERQVAILENTELGKVAMIEVGALGVGKIVQCAYSSRDSLPIKFDKGQEKGYFLFGGSTVIWLVQKGKIKISSDLAANSAKGLETWIPLGEPLGEVT